MSSEPSLSSDFKYRVKIRKCSPEPCPSEVRLYFDKYIEPGTEAEVFMKLKLKNYGLVPGIYARPYCKAIPIEIKIKKVSKDIRWTVEKQREKLNDLFERIFNEKAAGLSKALITGAKDVDPDLRESFRKTGLSHLLTISGTHFGLLFFLFFRITKRIISFLPYRVFHRLTTEVSINFISVIIVVPFLTWYFVISGMDIPAFRAFIMAILFVSGLMIERRYYWLAGLLIAATIILIIEPYSFSDLSFLLSFSAVFFIGLWFRQFKKEHDSTEGILKKRLIVPFINTFFISLSATLGTLPLILYFFHYLPLTGILSNILITPLVCFVLLPLLLFFSFFYLLTGHLILKDLLEGIINFVIKIVELFASFKYSEITVLPFPVVVLLALYFFLILFLLLNRLRYFYLAFFIIIILFLTIRTDRTPQITFLDVGQGDSTVIELPDGRTVVIDTGKSGIETSAYLRYRGKRTIDVLILTHPHPDHTGGLRLLKENFKIKEIWDNGFLLYPEDLRDIPRRALKRGDYISARGYSFYVLHPYQGFYTSGDRYSYENNTSLVLKAIINGVSVLFTGDIEREAEADILYLGEILNSDILKIPHHGSRYSTYKNFFELISPEFAIISAGARNPYGHPHREVLNSLKDSNVFITSSTGTIKILLKGNLYVKLYKDFRLVETRSLLVEISNIKNLFRTF
ncbi:MAG: DNA internalization-related competence protein ComEC/Rec2 [Thermodesulfovibrionales bacterium]|nr:DNA internalization-related competence protein ComEC/Rec2 [Thermodesulfovibrionales bacterium]